jgi:outer membrane protein
MKITKKMLLSTVIASFAACTAIADTSVVISKGTCGSDIGIVCSKALTLRQCYERALKQSETIAMTADLIKITDARFLQAISIMAPHFSFISNDYQEEKQTEISSLQGLAPSKSSVRQFNMTETIFSGFRALEAVKASKQEKKQRTKEKERAEQLLLVDVSNYFYLLMETREDLRALKKIELALNGRVNELRERERLGRSRPSEIVNAKAQFYSVKADIEVAKTQEILARQILEFLIGAPAGNLEDTSELPPKLMPEGYYVAMADDRPDVQATKFGWDFAKSSARMIDSNFLPTVSVDANYYTQRTAFDKGVDWDVDLAVNVPIFDGGLTLGQSKQAWLDADRSRLEYQRTRRKAPYDIKDAYARLKTAMAVRETRRKQYNTAKLNDHLQKRDYLRSLVSNLDVLAAIQTLLDSQRNYIHALYEAKRQYWQLRVAVGQGMPEVLHDAF